MKITKRQLRRIIRESLLLEEPADYYKDYRAGTITRAEYEQLVRDFEAGSTGQTTPSRAPQPSQQSSSRPGKKWKGSKQELTQKVHQYLIDIGFYKGFEGRDGNMYVDPFSKPKGPGAHPKGGFTSNIPDVLEAAVESGDIDWATWDEMYPVYKAIDRSID